jgi:hypothetical protein
MRTKSNLSAVLIVSTIMAGTVLLNCSLPVYAQTFENDKTTAAVQLPPVSSASKVKTSSMTVDKAIYRLSDKYGFSETELAEYVQTAADYKKMKELCLYARLSKRPLAEVVSFSEVYPKGRLRMVLGLTPQKLFDKTIELRADRLWEKMQIERKLTVKYMKQGFAGHHVMMAHELAKRCDKSMDDIIRMKTPKNKWKDIGAQLGISSSEMQEIKTNSKKAFEGPYYRP